MRIPRLPRPWKWRFGRFRVAAAGATVGRTEHQDDIRLLRRTRLRLMGVSGLVTLLILVVLEGAVYVVVSDRIETSARDQLTTAAIHETVSDDPYVFNVEGPTAGLLPLVIDPQGNVGAPRGLTNIPAGLPIQAGLSAVTKVGQLDIREVTLPGGTQIRVLSAYSARAVGFKVQWVQFRSGEVNLLNLLAVVLLGGGLAALLFALLAGYLYAGRALIPIRESIVRRQAALMRQREFAANASHELRTPLTVIGASVEDLKRNRRSKVEDVGEALGDIEAEVRHMTALVEDMLLLARTDSGVVEIERIPVDLGDIAAEAASMLAMLGQDRGVKVVLDPLPAPLFGDPLRLRQLVTILADNAIRHSPAGSVVEVRVRPAVGAVVLQVDDSGHGIRPQDLPRLFERFWRADDAPSGGTGLGLAIAKWIVDQHGGRIGAVNRPEGGASFRVWLPNGPAQSQPDTGRVNIGAGAIGPDERGSNETEPPEV
jgi:two-component system sensor histidine kinase CiaH